ncbi:DUF3833 family protein [Sulfitobacter aestuariivivens]|uniref:DUF3833 family protein n=1 Tax=Sulfitobacter aestuariivivens TaxID=2766981 RepID=A0A927D6E9_9RHOB|nr:DUF3833 family protein [Sulfitobacter aestuariivivens]MBD3665779.1 DUF3833 family protein [Sulfitobacter aestuariivivens]
MLRRSFAEFPGQKPEEYVDDYPALDLRSSLRGPLICEGVIFGPMGRVTSRFVADFHPVWDGDTCVMKEEFRYDDGSKQLREWTLKFASDGTFVATAPDVPGQGTGKQAGPTVCLTYQIKMPEDAGGHVLSTVDWMYLTPSGTIVNRSQFRKFGFRVAELVATIRPVTST